jgi:hypothetical protein
MNGCSVATSFWNNRYERARNVDIRNDADRRYRARRYRRATVAPDNPDRAGVHS